MSNTSSSSSGERAMQRRRAVEIIFPSQAEAAADFVDDGVSIPRVCATASATVAPSAGSGNMEDPQTLIDKALAELPQELADLAKDPKNHARSKDPGWKYGFWPNETKKEMVQCIFCKKVVPAGIRRFKQHLCGGFGDTEKCPKAPAIVRKEMRDYLVQNTRSKPTLMEEENVQTAEEECEGEVVVMPSSGTKAKETKRKVIAQASITSFVGKKYVKSVSSMLCKTPEEVVNQRHSSTSSQPTLEHCTKIRELGSKGKRSNPLHLEEFQWESEWVVADNDSVHQGAAHDVGDLTRGDVDEAIGASQGLSGRNLPRAAAAHARNLWTNEFPTRKRTSRKRPRQAEPTINENEILEDDEESESEEMQKNGEDGSGPSSSFGNENAFQVDEDLL